MIGQAEIVVRAEIDDFALCPRILVFCGLRDLAFGLIETCRADLCQLLFHRTCLECCVGHGACAW